MTAKCGLGIICMAILVGSTGCVHQLLALHELESKGASIGVDWSYVEFHNEKLSDRDVKSLSWELRAINPSYIGLNETAITDRALTHLSGVKDLRTLSVVGTSVTPQGIDAFVQAAPPSLELVVLPDHWDQDPTLASELSSLTARHPHVKFHLGDREGAVVEARLPVLPPGPTTSEIKEPLRPGE